MVVYQISSCNSLKRIWWTASTWIFLLSVQRAKKKPSGLSIVISHQRRDFIGQVCLIGVFSCYPNIDIEALWHVVIFHHNFFIVHLVSEE